LEFGCKISGCTVHFVDNEFDHGPIIAQETVSVFGRETPEELAARVFELECSLYPRTINRLLHEAWAIRGRTVEFGNQIG
jgi:phosphoribosylglycinamide formyltransferase-1